MAVEISIETWLAQHGSQFVITAIRVGSWIAFAPVFGNSALPVRIKAGISLALVAVLYPAAAGQVVPDSSWGWARVILSESILGLLMGLTLHFVFDGIQFAGQLLGIQLGHALASMIDPHTQVDTPVASVFFQVVALLLFLQFNGHHWILRGLAGSFELVPSGSAFASAGMATEVVRLAGGLWKIGIEMAAPILLVTVLADVALGFLGKQSPQLPVLLEGISIKSIAGLAVLIGAVANWPNLLERYFLIAIRSMQQLMLAMH